MEESQPHLPGGETETQSSEDMAGQGFEPKADWHGSQGSEGVRSQVLAYRSLCGDSGTHVTQR